MIGEGVWNYVDEYGVVHINFWQLFNWGQENDDEINTSSIDFADRDMDHDDSLMDVDESGYKSFDADELDASCQCQEQQWPNKLRNRCFFAGVSLEEMDEFQKLDL